MQIRKILAMVTLVVTLTLLLAAGSTLAGSQARLTADNPSPPASPVKLIFIHHSCGGNWLADVGEHDKAGGLGQELMDNNYFVSATNYDWGPNWPPQGAPIGDYTDIGHWWVWFRGTYSEIILSSLHTETGKNLHGFGDYTRTSDPEPARENEIVMFKSCYPNSHLGGNPDDEATSGEELRGWDAWSGDARHNVGNAKGIYNSLLEYFATRQDKLFIAVTAPPLLEGDMSQPTDAAHAANARAFNDWLVNDWLDSYPHNNVAVFDFYNVLTSNGGDINTNDYESRPDGNHHYWNGSEVTHTQTLDNNFAAYASGGDSHPTAAGNQKATAEFVPLLNVFYHRWKGDEGRPTPTATGAPPTATPTATATPTRTGPPPTYHFVYLPLIVKDWSPPTPTPTPTSTTAIPSSLIQPSDLAYQGALRLPADPAGRGWEWANWSSALTYYPDGDPSGAADGHPGSLFGSGHDWYQYVSQVNIPAPVISPHKDVNDLNAAAILQPFADIRGGLFDEMEMPRVGLAYLPPQGAQIRGKLYFAWAPHLGERATNPSHGWCELDLSNPRTAGAWRIGDYWNYVTGDYLFDIPQAWADAYVSGHSLATGRFRDGGQGAQGPSLFAIAPWEHGNPPAAGSTVAATPLLLYTAVTDPEQHALNGYHHSDEWTGAAWLTAGSKSAVVFVGTKGTGDCWYGCADGTDQPPWPPDCDRGWWSTGFVGQMLLYDPADLVAVVRGEMEPWEPQPYATLDLDTYLYHVESTQQKYHLGAAAFDRARELLYVLEPLADEDRPLVHVWRVEG